MQKKAQVDLINYVPPFFLTEPTDRLKAIFFDLMNTVNREFFEVSERGTNFQYLAEEQKGYMLEFFMWFKDSGKIDEEFLRKIYQKKLAEATKAKRDQLAI